MKPFNEAEFDPTKLDAEQLAHVIQKMVHGIRYNMLDQAFPIQCDVEHDPVAAAKASSIMATVMLHVAATYARDGGWDPTEWLRIQVEHNEKHQAVRKAQADALNN